MVVVTVPVIFLVMVLAATPPLTADGCWLMTGLARPPVAARCSPAAARSCSASRSSPDRAEERIRAPTRRSVPLYTRRHYTLRVLGDIGFEPENHHARPFFANGRFDVGQQGEPHAAQRLLERGVGEVGRAHPGGHLALAV